MGNFDPDNATVTALRGIARSWIAAEVDVVLGAAAPHLAAVRAAMGEMAQTVRLHLSVADMAGPMAAADLAIGAGGTTSWERCCLGLPTLLIVLADNQRRIAEATAAAGAAESLGWHGAVTPDSVAAALSALAAEPARLRHMAERTAALCDGRGARRVASLLGGMAARDGRPVTLRRVEQADATILYDWQKAPETRRFMRNPQIPEWDEHCRWLAHRLADDESRIWMILHGGEPVGVARLDPAPAELGAESDAFEISILVAPDRHRQGIGRAALRLVRELAPGARLYAMVLPGNVASAALFREAGYRPSGAWLVSCPEPTIKDEAPKAAISLQRGTALRWDHVI